MARSSNRSQRRVRSAPPPLDARRLEELSLAYVARFATTAGRLAVYCRRKLRERGYVGAEDGTPPPDVDGLVAKFVAAGYVDDAGYARMKAGSLLRRGYGARRVEQALRADAVAGELREAVTPDESARRQAAAQYAERRRLGPFMRPGSPEPDPRLREKQLAALLRAGHDASHARRVLAAATPAEVAEWIGEALD